MFTTYTVIAHSDNQVMYVVTEPDNQKTHNGPVMQNVDVQMLPNSIALIVWNTNEDEFAKATFTCNQMQFAECLEAAISFTTFGNDAINWPVEHVVGKNEDWGVL
jgi:hypothetical protein